MTRTTDIIGKPIAPCHESRNYSGARNRLARADSYGKSRNAWMDPSYMAKYVKERDLRRPGIDGGYDSDTDNLDDHSVWGKPLGYRPFTTESRGFAWNPRPRTTEAEIERMRKLAEEEAKPHLDLMRLCTNVRPRRSMYA